MFHTENAELLSESAVFSFERMLPEWWVVCRVVIGNLSY